MFATTSAIAKRTRSGARINTYPDLRASGFQDSFGFGLPKSEAFSSATIVCDMIIIDGMERAGSRFSTGERTASRPSNRFARFVAWISPSLYCEGIVYIYTYIPLYGYTLYVKVVPFQDVCVVECVLASIRRSPHWIRFNHLMVFSFSINDENAWCVYVWDDLHVVYMYATPIEYG